MTEETQNALFRGPGLIGAPCLPLPFLVGVALVQMQVSAAQEVANSSVRTGRALVKLHQSWFPFW